MGEGDGGSLCVMDVDGWEGGSEGGLPCCHGLCSYS